MAENLGYRIENGYYVWSDGRRRPVISGGSDDAGDGANGPGGNAGSASSASDTDGTRTFTQEDMQRIAAREKKEGKRAGQREVLEMLGVDDVDAAKDALAAWRQFQENQQSEADKAKAAAEKARQDAEATKAEAARERFEAQLERKLTRAGLVIPDDDDTDETISMAIRMLALDASADPEDVDEAVDKLKTRFPAMFTPKSDTDTRPKPKGSNPGAPPRGATTNASAEERAKQRLAARHPNFANK